MKKLAHATLAVFMLVGLFAAADFPKTQDTDITPVMANGPAPMPLCAPGDNTCDPGVPFPRPTTPPRPSVQ